MTKNGAIFSRANFFQTHVEYLLITVVISMMLASLAASLLVNNLQTVKKLINAKQVFLFAILLALLTIIYYCYANNIVLLGILGLFLGAAMGWILRYSDITPALFMFVLAEPADRTIFNVMQLYF
jgi:hypothetical protein